MDLAPGVAASDGGQEGCNPRGHSSRQVTRPPGNSIPRFSPGGYNCLLLL
jgi:hypothetical protein